MKLNLKLSIDFHEVKRYLHYRAKEVDQDTKIQINECSTEILEIASPKFEYRQFDLLPFPEGYQLRNTIVKLTSKQEPLRTGTGSLRHWPD